MLQRFTWCKKCVPRSVLQQDQQVGQASNPHQVLNMPISATAIIGGSWYMHKMPFELAALAAATDCGCSRGAAAGGHAPQCVALTQHYMLRVQGVAILQLLVPLGPSRGSYEKNPLCAERVIVRLPSRIIEDMLPSGFPAMHQSVARVAHQSNPYLLMLCCCLRCAPVLLLFFAG